MAKPRRYDTSKTDLRLPGQKMLAPGSRPRTRAGSAAKDNRKVVERLYPFGSDDDDWASRTTPPKEGAPGGKKKITEFIVWKILKIGRPRSP